MAIEKGNCEKEISAPVASSRPCLGTSTMPGTGDPKEQKINAAIAYKETLRSIKHLVKNNQLPDVLTDQGLKSENYCVFFSALLMFEELQLEEEMKAHDTKLAVTKRKLDSFSLSLQIPGIAEKKPSLSKGDSMFFKLADADDEYKLHGVIDHVVADQVSLELPEIYNKYYISGVYDLRFKPSKINIKRMYRAIEHAWGLEADFLFPVTCTRRLINSVPFVPFNSNLNKEQRRSIEMILGCKGAPPYAIFGPPGTGKTSTLVEAILQVYKIKNDSRILVCSPSNSTADHILENLINSDITDVQKNTILRLNSPHRFCQDVHSDLVPFCSFKCPKLKVLNGYRVIISTYMSSALLYSVVGKGHFSHIFLDEAGQASEAECMVPISYLCRKETVVVLAGDPKQLGPVIHSKNAEKFGLGKSYLERLFEFDHCNDGDEFYVTKLVRNYRCHPKILDLPSELFYKGELLACKEDNSPSIAAEFHLLPNKQFPILFYGIRGCNERERNNPSWFNQNEASKVVEIINFLRQITDIKEADIGVIAPYRQQVVKIEKILETQEIKQVKVGSVEQFQGQEREVIIISTVRSMMKHNELSRINCLGFLSNPRRFNVAITRAKSLLIIVGNPHVICQDPYWDMLLRYCTSNKSYVGCPFPDATELSDPNPPTRRRIKSVVVRSN